MGTVALLALLAVLSQGYAFRNIKMMKTMHSQFMIKYNRVYSSPEEESRRFGIFVQNLKWADQLNARRDGATYGVTQFADWTREEFKKFLMPAKMKSPLEDIAEPAPVQKVDGIPENFDWKTKNAVTPAKNQDRCGGCWAFATIGLIEAQYAIKNGKMLDLSEQQLIDCETYSDGCDGGSYPVALKWTMAHGVLTEQEYPFLNMNGPSCPAKNGNIFLSKVYQIEQDADKMAAFIYNTGPIALHFRVGGNLMMYTDGIYHPTPRECEYPDGSHAVLAVGYGVENGEKYWLIKNSWGPRWGDNGYFKMIRGIDCCEIELRPFGGTL